MKAINFTKIALEKLKHTQETYRIADQKTTGLSIEVRAEPLAMSKTNSIPNYFLKLIPERKGRLMDSRTHTDSDGTTINPTYHVEFCCSSMSLYGALLKTENIELEFSDDGIDTIANIASEVNATVENIGARRLHTIIEKILDEISFTATDRSGEKIIINKEYINKNLDNLAKDTDLSKFIL